MKIIMHAFTMLLLCLCGTALKAVNTDPVSVTPLTGVTEPECVDPAVKIKVKVTVDFGRRKKDCTGFGICSITVEAEMDEINLARSGSTGNAWVENGVLYVDFKRASMSNDVYQKYFGTGRLLIEEDFTLPPDVAASLGVRAYTIKAGTYLGTVTAGNTTTQVAF